MKKLFLYPMLLSLVALAFAACNSSSDDSVYTYYSSSSESSTLIANFALQANSKIMHNLDSVYFTIDQENALIYNADSLPKGTDVSRLCVDITFPQTISSAVFTITGGTVQRNTIIEYSSTTNDTIDFTGDVKLKITSENEGRSVTYTVKVNVHQLEPDTLYWDQAQRRDVPGATSNSKAQRTVDFNGKYYCIAQNGNAFNLSTSATISAGWTTQAVTLPFEPVVTSFTATTTAMYILSKQGDLYTSPDATNWTATGHSMAHILGAYDDRIIGLSLDGSTYIHDEYPAPDGFTSSPVDDQFPVYGNSPMVQASNTWGLSHQAMIAGGVNSKGQPLNIVWGYDGNVWGMVSNTAAGALPELVEPVLMAYKTTELDTVTLKASVRDTWLVMGGKKADGTINSETFASYDQGVKWSKATTSMQLPQYITPFYGAQAFVVTETLSLPKAKAFRVKTNNNQWDCPFIYIIGGYAHNGTFLNNIWKGVINRLAFKPVY